MGKAVATVLRIRRVAGVRSTSGADYTKNYLDRLVRLIPAEIVSLYLAGRAILLAQTPPAGADPAALTSPLLWVIWTIFCLAAIFAVRIWATSDPQSPPEWAAIGIAAISFLIWVYSMGRRLPAARPAVESHFRQSDGARLDLSCADILPRSGPQPPRRGRPLQRRRLPRGHQVERNSAERDSQTTKTAQAPKICQGMAS